MFSLVAYKHIFSWTDKTVPQYYTKKVKKPRGARDKIVPVNKLFQ